MLEASRARSRLLSSHHASSERPASGTKHEARPALFKLSSRVISSTATATTPTPTPTPTSPTPSSPDIPAWEVPRRYNSWATMTPHSPSQRYLSTRGGSYDVRFSYQTLALLHLRIFVCPLELTLKSSPPALLRRRRPERSRLRQRPLHPRRNPIPAAGLAAEMEGREFPRVGL